MKYLTGVILAAVLIAAAGYMLMPRSPVLNIRCEAEVLHTINEQEGSVTLDATAALFMLSDGSGFVNLYGSLASRDTLWLVNRKILFDWRYEHHDRLYDIAIRQVEIKKDLDKAPDSLMSRIYSRQFNMEIFRTGKNGLYLRGVSTPFFFCVQKDKSGRLA